MRIMIGMVVQEGNSFSPKVSRLIPEHCTRFQGDEIIRNFTGTKTPLGAYLSIAAREGAEICCTESVLFVSSGCVLRAAFDEIAGNMVSAAREFKPDIMFLFLHGSLIVEDCSDGDGLLLKMLRDAAGERCIIASPFDMHAYMTTEMITNVSILSGYKTYPHIDQYERAVQVAELALKIYKKKKTVFTALTRVPLLVPAERGCTDGKPIGPLIDYGTELENEDKILSFALSVIQPWMDVPYTGGAVSVCAETPDAAIRYSCQLADMFWAVRHDSQAFCVPVGDAIKTARRMCGGKPVLFVDSADSPGAGATSDSSYLVQALMEDGADLKSLISVVDKEVAVFVESLPDGALIECMLGFKENPLFGKPISFKGVVERHCKPTAELHGHKAMFSSFDFGRRSVLKSGNTYVMVLENAGCGHDPAIYESAGFDLSGFDVVCVRSALSYKFHYAGLFSLDILIDSPGASSPNLSSMPFRHTVWPVFPLDKNAIFTPHTVLSARDTF